MINSGRPVVGAPGWRLSDEGGFLVAVAGADEIWVVDDVPGTAATELAACWTDRPPTPDELSGEARLAVEQLRAVGVFGPLNTIPAAPRLAIRWAGSAVPAMLDALIDLCRELDWPEPVQASTIDEAVVGTGEPSVRAFPDDAGQLSISDLEIVVRSNATLVDTAQLVAPVTTAGRIQLLCDLASSRTIALGPLVVPGHTACIGCLSGRVGSRWGDPELPSRPGATEATGATIAAGWVMHQIRLATESRFPLVDATISIDLDNLETRRSPCLRSSRCPDCADPLSDGRVQLPWLR